MSTNNRVLLTGNLGKDPEVKNLENGNKLAKFSLATKDEFVSRSGEKSENTQWHFITAWGKVAERVEAEMKKGSLVSVDGRLATHTYTDKAGQKRYVTDIIANDVQVKVA
jgi:single-strand DNA-binding protein